jgi:uncharacterized protein YggE
MARTLGGPNEEPLVDRTPYLLFALGVAAPSPLAAQESPGPTATAPEVRTSGGAAKTVQPNLVTVTIEFSVKRRTPGDAGRANAERAVAIRRALTALGIPRDSIVTAGYRSELTFSDGYQRDTGFVASNTLVARIRDLRLIGPAIDTALAEGATRVTNVHYSASDVDRPYLEALRDASLAARQRAEVMAKAMGGRLGRLIELTTEARRYSDDGLIDLREITVTAAAATPIQAPTLQLTATVYGRWEFVRD